MGSVSGRRSGLAVSKSSEQRSHLDPTPAPSVSLLPSCGENRADPSSGQTDLELPNRGRQDLASNFTPRSPPAEDQRGPIGNGLVRGTRAMQFGHARVCLVPAPFCPAKDRFQSHYAQRALRMRSSQSPLWTTFAYRPANAWRIFCFERLTAASQPLGRM